MKKIIFIFFIFIFCISFVNISFAQTENKAEFNIPVSTRWILDAVGETGRTAINSVYMIVCPKTSKKGTGFLIKTGQVITNEHVVRDCLASEIYAYSSYGKKTSFCQMILDKERDLAILIPTEKIQGGLSLGSDDNLLVGTLVSTWGFPLGYNGPAPILSVGYLSGFKAYEKNNSGKDVIKHLVVNGAFNPGNSGGPLFISNDDKVIGIVVSKHAPISNFLLSSIEALAKNRTGVGFTFIDNEGNEKLLIESQIVAELLQYFRDLTQVMIGEAISISELKAFLYDNDIICEN
jgi:S1-C subfamily serine protease